MQRGEEPNRGKLKGAKKKDEKGKKGLRSVKGNFPRAFARPGDRKPKAKREKRCQKKNPDWRMRIWVRCPDIGTKQTSSAVRKRAALYGERKRET